VEASREHIKIDGKVFRLPGKTFPQKEIFKSVTFTVYRNKTVPSRQETEGELASIS
jgi:hypothetical protein